MPLSGALALFFGFLVTSCYAITEAESLLAIKNKVGLNSYNLYTWTSDSDPCNSTWYGVTCSNSTVTKLNLTKAGLTGEIPSEIGNLVNLQVLDLHSNSLTGSIPSSFKNLVNLQALNFSRNTLGGSFPDVLLDMTNLVDLRCGGCNLIGQLPTGIKRLSNLKYLHINNNSFSGDLPEELYALKELIELNLWGNPLGTNLSAHLGFFKNLNLLKMHQCELSGTLPTEWATNFTKLNTLWLSDNKLQGDISDTWGSMISLLELKLSDNQLSGSVPSWLESATLLNTDLSCNFLTGSKPILPYSKYKKVDGNCYTGEADTRKNSCKDKQSCNPTHHIKPWVVVLIVIAIMCVVTPLIIWLYCKHRRRSKRRRRGTMNFNTDGFSTTIKSFTLEQLSNATNKFSKGHEIGHGGFGKVYIGYFKDGKTVAIKKANPNKVLDSAEFTNEIRLLSRLHHRHLVHLLGWCDEDENQILVYEYMQNGNLQERLLGNKYEPLNFYQRVDIAVGVARGLDYLHSFADPPVIHRDMKPSNVLLDENLVAKISDFGISRDTLMLRTHVSTRPAGTAGYLDPEYFLREQLTTSSDVYAFGIILLQLITGQQVINQERNLDVNLVEWVRETLILGIHEVVDPRLGHNYPKDVFEEIANLGLQCASLSRNDRPTLQEVLQRLESFLTELTKPKVTEDETIVLLDKPASSDIECCTSNIPTISDLWPKLSAR